METPETGAIDDAKSDTRAALLRALSHRLSDLHVRMCCEVEGGASVANDDSDTLETIALTIVVQEVAIRRLLDRLHFGTPVTIAEAVKFRVETCYEGLRYEHYGVLDAAADLQLDKLARGGAK